MTTINAEYDVAAVEAELKYYEGKKKPFLILVNPTGLTTINGSFRCVTCARSGNNGRFAWNAVKLIVGLGFDGGKSEDELFKIILHNRHIEIVRAGRGDASYSIRNEPPEE